MATQLATRGDDRYLVLRQQLDKRADDFKSALPAHITPEKFQRTVMTAVQTNPDLLNADRATFITSAMKAAQDGLLPDGREAAIVTFKNRKNVDGQWVDVIAAQYMPMAFGLRKKILQSGEISALETNVVYRREVEEGAFIFEAGTEATLRHRPMLDLSDEDLSDDNIVAAYSVAVMKDGTKSFEVMRRAEINKVRQASQTGAVGRVVKFGQNKGQPIEPKGPWVDWFGEMARKTVMRRHSKTLPMSGDILDVEDADDTLYAHSAMRTLGAGGDAALEPQPATLPSRSETAALAHNPDTGEVLDDETLAQLDRESLRQMDGNDGLLSEENPTAGEGRADSERGDLFDSSDPAAAKEREITEFIEAAIDADALGKVMQQNRTHMAAMDEERQNRIWAANNKRKAQLMGARG